jgi:hypothetical protein
MLSNGSIEGKGGRCALSERWTIRMRMSQIVCSMPKVRAERSQREQLTLVSAFGSGSDDAAPFISYTVASPWQL